MTSGEEIGRFIAEMRRERGMTQRELAEELGLSDKTVSKWETGRGLPDVSVMESLCGTLGISLNELLSGERLSVESYAEKAEENMKDLVRKSEEERKEGAWGKIGTGLATLVLVVLAAWALLASAPKMNPLWFWDDPTALFMAGAGLSMLVLSGNLRHFAGAFLIILGKIKPDAETVEKSAEALRFAARANVLMAAFLTFMSAIAVLGNLSDPSMLGPSIAVAILAPLYAVVLNAVLLIAEGRVSRK